MSVLPAPIAFGTDGVRGPAGQWPLTAEGARIIAKAVAEQVRQGDEAPLVLVGRDTRLSGESLSEAVARGVIEGGGEVVDGGVLPTAAVSTGVVALGCGAGIVVTASHNPWQDNGLKVLGADGGKDIDLPGIVARFGAPPRHAATGRRLHQPEVIEHWVAAMPRLELSGLNILLDAAHGAGAPHAPAVLEAMGARLVLRGCAPDGRNINDGVGAMHPPTKDELQGCELAICLDGDADRVQLVDASHGLLDGDDILWMLAGAGEQPVVGTVMSNGGLGAALGERLLRASVGDRHVAAMMREADAPIGAEPSGHVLFSDGMPTGDGLYAALRVLQACAGPDGRPRLPLPVGGWTRWPQASHNLRYGGARPSIEGLASQAGAEAAGFRVVVRYSGTEPKVRIFVEGPGDPAAWCRRITGELESRSVSP